MTGNAGDMALFIFNGRGPTEEEIALGTPDLSEAKSLPRHVEKCALRYRIFTRRQAEQGQDIAQIKYMVVALILAIFLTSPQLREFLSWASKYILGA